MTYRSPPLSPVVNSVSIPAIRTAPLAPIVPTEILITESKSLTREALKHWLEKIPVVERVCAIRSFKECFEQVRETSFSLAILPIHFEQQSGAEVAMELKKICPTLKIAFWVGDTSDSLLCEALSCQPTGLISLHDTPESIQQTIETLLTGTPTYSSLLDERVVKIRKHLSGPRTQKDIIGLTPRQKEVLRYLAKGHTVKEVAGKMHLSAKSVDSHKYRIMKKLNIHDRVHLARFAIREGLLDAR